MTALVLLVSVVAADEHGAMKFDPATIEDRIEAVLENVPSICVIDRDAFEDFQHSASVGLTLGKSRPIDPGTVLLTYVTEPSRDGILINCSSRLATPKKSERNRRIHLDRLQCEADGKRFRFKANIRADLKIGCLISVEELRLMADSKSAKLFHRFPDFTYELTEGDRNAIRDFVSMIDKVRAAGGKK